MENEDDRKTVEESGPSKDFETPSQTIPEASSDTGK